MVTTTSRLGLSKSEASDSYQTTRTGNNSNCEILDDALLTNAGTTFNAGLGNGAVATNTAFGTTTLDAITTGYQNTAIGYESMRVTTTGVANTCAGYRSGGSLTTGSNNTAFGQYALWTLVSGSNNTAIGRTSLYYATGSNNTAVGHAAGNAITTGSNLTCIGYNAAASAVDATNEITLGDTHVSTLRCTTTTITAISDVRDKTNIETLPLGLDFLRDLKPVRWNWRKRIQTDDGLIENPEVGAQDLGFVAQDLDAAQEKHSAAWLGLVLKANPDRWEATPGKLLPVMVKAIQELAAENESLKARLSALEA